MSNESILSLSDDVKASMRAYASMAGFLLLGILRVSAIVMNSTALYSVMLVGSSILVLIGVVLAFLHKRDLFAIFFMLTGFVYIVFSQGYMPVAYLAAGILDIFLAVAFCLTRNEQRIVISALLLILGIDGILSYIGQFGAVTIITAIAGIGCIYNAFAIGCERFKLPFRDILMADEENPSNDGEPVHFKVSGTTIVIAVNMYVTLTVLLASLGLGTMTGEQRSTIFYALSLIDILAGIIMLTAGRMRQTPFIFILLGAIVLILASATDSGSLTMFTIAALILGILILLRSESRILLGLMVIIIGLDLVPLIVDPSLSIISDVLNLVLVVLQAYIILALNSNGKLKLI